jgi:2-dehydro-3-deoxyphosphogluconate aldolase/(4S)-4-hydroxy-2-oxoglutarate aldolase
MMPRSSAGPAWLSTEANWHRDWVDPHVDRVIDSRQPCRPPIPHEISGPRVVAIARGINPDKLARVADGLIAGGIRALEITLNSPSAIDALAGLSRRFESSPLLLGAGTVLDIPAAVAAQAAGARFLISPHFDPALVSWASSANLPCVPGALTPTEILAAWRGGACAVKLFPASTVGPSFVREFRGPFSDIPLIPTGGVTLDGAVALVAAGSMAVGVGSWLMGDGDLAGIGARGAQLVRALAAEQA